MTYLDGDGRTARKITCIVCTYNYGRYLHRCLSSLVQQTLDPALREVIVVDDGSTDETCDVLQSFADSVRVIRQSNRGLAAASNTGLLHSSCEYVLRVDADDEIVPEALESLALALDSDPRLAAAYADRVQINVRSGRESVKHVEEANIYEIIAPGVMFRRSRVLEVGLYRPMYWEEHDLMIRILSRYPIVHVPAALYRYYIHGENMTADASARRDGWRALIDEWGIDELRRWGREPELEDVFSGMCAPVIE